jgi:hypothetical protein
MAHRGAFPPRDCRELRSIASTVRSTEEEILNEWIARLLKLTRRSVKIDPAFVQVGDSVGYIKCAFHIVGNNHAGHSKALLQPANQSIDAIGDYRIKTGCRLIVQYTRGPPNDGARQPDPLFSSAAQTFRHLIFLTFHFHHSSISLTFERELSDRARRLRAKERQCCLQPSSNQKARHLEIECRPFCRIAPSWRSFIPMMFCPESKFPRSRAPSTQPCVSAKRSCRHRCAQ